MPVAGIARRLLGGARRRKSPGRSAAGSGSTGGSAGAGKDAQVGRAARKGLRRLRR